MEFFAALAFGWIEWTFLAVFFLCLIVGTSMDRSGVESPKWYVLGIGFIAIGAYYWKDLSVSSIWVLLSSWAFWKPIVIYFAIGLLYSLLEFFLTIRRTAREYRTLWQSWLDLRRDFPVLDVDGKPVMEPRLNNRGEPIRNNGGGGGDIIMDPVMRQGTYAEIYRTVGEEGPASGLFNEVNGRTKEFIYSIERRNQLISVQLAADKISVEPNVNRAELAESIGAWTFLWPPYLVSLVVGDLLTEVFKSLADFLANISSRFVKLSFANVFKF